MQKLFSNQDKKFLSQVDKSEKELQQFFWHNRKELFPEYTFIKDEFPLKGDARSSGGSGRIDILAYNPDTKRFIVIELKKIFGENITHQADDYRYYIQKHFADVYLDAFQKYKAALPEKSAINETEIEVILIAKSFSSVQIDRAKKAKDCPITLIKYNWYGNDFFLLDYVNNAPVTPQGGQKPTSEKNQCKDWQGIVESIAFGSKDLELKKYGERLLKYSPLTKENADDNRRILKKAPKSDTNHKFNSKIDYLRKILDELEQTEK